MLGMDAQLNIISYAVISTKYESSSNLIESFLPLIEHALTCLKTDYIKEVDINDTYEEIYGYRIHSAILSQLLKLLEKQGKIERLKGESIQIDRDLQFDFSNKNVHKLKLRSLISEIDMFCKRKGHTVDKNGIAKGVIKFLQKYAVDFNSFVTYQSDIENIDEDDEFTHDLVEFLLEERRNNTKHYTFVQEIYAGILLSSIIVFSEDAVSVFNEDFHIKNVLMDSNYIFRLLDLQTSLEFQAAQETYEALKTVGCNFWVCKETLKQIADTIRAIVANCTVTTNQVLRIYGDTKFTGLASACIRRSLTASDLELLIDELEDTLTNKYNIKFIDDNIFNSNLIDIQGDQYKSLQNIKSEKSESSIVHDLLLIHIVSRKRSKTIYKMDQADWWVLTDDNKLTMWNANNSAIKGIPECITEAQLATIMWLCNPKQSSLDGLFNTIIALKGKELIGNGEYEKISKVIERQKERMSNNPKKLKKLSLVLSQRMLSLEDMLVDDSYVIDTKFDQLLDDSQEILNKKDKLIGEKEATIQEEKQKNNELSLQVTSAVSLLNEQTEKVIALLKEKKEDKQSTYDLLQNNLVQLHNKKIKRNKVFSFCIRVILAILLLAFFIHMLPLVASLETWYSQNQLRCTIAMFLLSVFTSMFGIHAKFINMLSENIIIRLLIKIKLMKNIEGEIKKLNQQVEELLEEMNQIQDEIDAELAK